MPPDKAVIDRDGPIAAAAAAADDNNEDDGATVDESTLECPINGMATLGDGNTLD
jgi:hypothetical protein